MNRPLLFTDMPHEVMVQVSELERLMILSPGDLVTIPTSVPSSLNGTIRSITPQNNNKLLTMIIKLSDRVGANLTLSMITDDNGQKRFVGKILSFQHGDCFVLQKEGDNYSFIKKGFYELVGE